jgi:hypothetical protein
VNTRLGVPPAEIVDEVVSEKLPVLFVPDHNVTPLRVTDFNVNVLGFGPLPPRGSQVAPTLESVIATPFRFVICVLIELLLTLIFEAVGD